MNYEYLKIFYHVCLNNSFSKTAKELYTSQPAISRVIQSLESELSCKLFVRNKHGITLTKEGKNLFDQIEGPFVQLQRIDETFKFNNAYSTIYIGATFTSLQIFVFDMLRDLGNNYPNIHYQIYTGSTSKIVDQVKQGKIDIAFVTTPFDKDNDLEITNIMSIKDIIIGGTKYQTLSEENHNLKELEVYPFLLLSSDSQFRIHINNFLFNNNIHITPAIETDSIGTILPMIEKNYGLTFMPQQMAKQSLNEKKCFQININEKIPLRHLVMVTSANHYHSNMIDRLKVFINNRTK